MSKELETSLATMKEMTSGAKRGEQLGGCVIDALETVRDDFKDVLAGGDKDALH